MNWVLFTIGFTIGFVATWVIARLFRVFKKKDEQ